MNLTVKWWLLWLLGIGALASTIILGVHNNAFWPTLLAGYLAIGCWPIQERLRVGRTAFWAELQYGLSSDGGEGIFPTIWMWVGFGPLAVLLSMADVCYTEGFEVRLRKLQVEADMSKRMKANPQLVKAWDLEAHCLRKIDESQSLLRQLETDLAAWQSSQLPTAPGEITRLRREITETKEAIQRYELGLEHLREQITSLKREIATPTDKVVQSADRFQQEADDTLTEILERIRAHQDLTDETASPLNRK